MEKDEFEKTVELLTPKFRKNSDFSFVKRKKRVSATVRRLWWRAGSVAAMVAVVVALAVNTLIPARAEDVVQKSLANFNAEKTYKVRFYIVGDIRDGKLIPSGENEITGTLYVLNDNGIEKDRIEFDNPEKLTEVYDGEFYKLYKNGVLTKKTRSNPIGLLDFFKLNTTKDLVEGLQLTSNGDMVTVSHRKGDLVMNGVFSRETNKLTEAYVTHKDKKVLGTRSIEYGVEIPDKFFE